MYVLNFIPDSLWHWGVCVKKCTLLPCSNLAASEVLIASREASDKTLPFTMYLMGYSDYKYKPFYLLSAIHTHHLAMSILNVSLLGQSDGLSFLNGLLITGYYHLWATDKSFLGHRYLIKDKLFDYCSRRKLGIE